MTKNKQIKIRLLLCIAMAAILAAVILGWILLERHIGWVDAFGESVNTEMVISLNDGFYRDNQTLTVAFPEGAVVYYTDNCELPDRENGTQYTEPIEVKTVEGEKIYIYRFKAFYEDGTESDVETRTYFMGEDIRERFTTPVLHITGESDGLFGYENGIFVPGKLFDEFMKENPDAYFGSGVDANFMQRGTESEREVYIQYFNADGTELLAQNGGVRIHGSMSRMKNQKSFRLYARAEYDEQNEFNHIFLDDLVSERDGTLASKYKRLIVRSGGNDNGFAYIRSELASALAADAGFPDVMYAAPVCVYINGDYQGIYWLENGYDAQYFENRYGEYSGEFVVLEGADKQMSDSEDDTEQKYVKEFNKLYQKFGSMDLTKDGNYRKLRQFIDVDNYLQYFAIENYIGNLDWVDNNMKVYRYVSSDDDYMSDTVFDGRYRYLLYDLDYSFGLKVINESIGIAPETKTLPRILGQDTPVFAALMEREDCRNYFINYTCDLINGAMSAEHVSETLVDMHSSRNEELYHMMEETERAEEKLWNWETSVSTHYDNVIKNYFQIIRFARNRPQTVLEDIAEQLGVSCDDLYTLYVNRGDVFSAIQINSIKLEEEEFAGTYFASVPVTLKPCPAVNEVFDYWIVNGSIREEEELRLTADDVKDQTIRVEMAVHETEEPLLQINAVRARGRSDYIELVNYSHRTVSTVGYFLSDDDDCYKYALPVMNIAPGETKRFYGKDCVDLEGLGQFGLNFNIRREETVTLTYGRQTVETLLIPKLQEEGIYRRQGSTGGFMEVLQDIQSP